MFGRLPEADASVLLPIRLDMLRKESIVLGLVCAVHFFSQSLLIFMPFYFFFA